jgi:hypothetical protein
MNQIFRIGVFCSVFQAELIAIKVSIKWLTSILISNDEENYSEVREKLLSDKKVLLLSDSMSAISAIKQSNSLHPIVYDIKNLFKKYKIF